MALFLSFIACCTVPFHHHVSRSLPLPPEFSPQTCLQTSSILPWSSDYSKTSLNRTLLFQKVVRFSKISVYTKCRIAPANRKKFGLGGGFSDVSDRFSKPRQVRISARAVERGDASKLTCKPNMKARKLQANPNIVQIAPRLTEICSV